MLMIGDSCWLLAAAYMEAASLFTHIQANQIAFLTNIGIYVVIMRTNLANDSQIDLFDRKIIAELRVEGRLTVTALAERIGLSKTPCQIRLRRLIDEGYIRSFRAVVDPVQLGIGHIAFARIKLSDTRERALEEFRRGILQVEEVEECHMIASDFDYLVKVRTADILSYRAVLGEKISSLPHVASTSTFVVMETIIDQGG